MQLCSTLTLTVADKVVNLSATADRPRRSSRHPENGQSDKGSDVDKKLYEMQAELCKTLSNPKRLEILDILKEAGEICVNELAERLEIPKANTSQHLAVLRQAGVVNTRKDGINVYYSLRSQKITEACSLTRTILVERLEDQMGLTNLIREQD